MSKDELKEMVNSTIVTNGQKSITGQTLNLALNAIIDSLETGNICGARRIYATTTDNASSLTDEQITSNAMLYNEIKTIIDTDGTIPSIYYRLQSEDAITLLPITEYKYYSESEEGGTIFFYCTYGHIILYPDGAAESYVEI